MSRHLTGYVFSVFTILFLKFYGVSTQNSSKMMMSVLYNMSCDDIEETLQKTKSQQTRIRTISQSVDSKKGLANNTSHAYYDGKDVFLSHSSHDLSNSMDDCRHCKNNFKGCTCQTPQKEVTLNKVRRTQSCGTTSSLSGLVSNWGRKGENRNQKSQKSRGISQSSTGSDFDDSVFSDLNNGQIPRVEEGRENGALDLNEEEIGSSMNTDCVTEQSSSSTCDFMGNTAFDKNKEHASELQISHL